MTMLSPLGRVPQRRPPTRRRTRRPLPALVLLLALSILAAVVWLRVLHRGDESAAAACPGRRHTSATQLDPKRVKVRVYNSTNRGGLARTVADQLHRRGFSIAGTSNDPLSDTREVHGVGEIRYGTYGTQQATLLSWYLPGIKLTEDPRTDSIVDVAIGPGFRTLATSAQVSQSKKKAAARQAGTPGC
jgi:hypothetical protein